MNALYYCHKRFYAENVVKTTLTFSNIALDIFSAMGFISQYMARTDSQHYIKKDVREHVSSEVYTAYAPKAHAVATIWNK